MELLTKEIKARLLKAGEYGKENADGEQLCQVKFFDPCGSYTFLAYGAEEDPTYGMIFWGYGYINSEIGWEHGTVGLSQLKAYKGWLGLGMERDIWASDGKHTIEELMA